MITNQTPLEQLLNAAIPIVVALLGLLGSWLTAAIRTKVKNETARGFLLRLSEQASDVVLSLEQTAVSKLRDLASDGKLDSQDVAMLKETALVKLKEHLGSKGKSMAMAALGFQDEAQLETVLKAKLEAELTKSKAVIGPKIKGILEAAPRPAGVS